MLKLSGEVLQGEKGSGIDFGYLESLCREIVEVRKFGVKIAIVIGGGNFWRYRDFKDSGLDRVHSDYMGMLATVMNSMAMANAFVRLGVEAKAFSAISMPTVLPVYYVDKVREELDDGDIVICAGGTGSPFFTTDSAAALRALELKCDVLMKATKENYVFDKDPAKYADAKAFKKLSYRAVLDKGLEVMDLSAVSLCSDSKMPIVVFNQRKKGNIAKVVKGEPIGTLIS